MMEPHQQHQKTDEQNYKNQSLKIVDKTLSELITSESLSTLNDDLHEPLKSAQNVKSKNEDNQKEEIGKKFSDKNDLETAKNLAEIESYEINKKTHSQEPDLETVKKPDDEDDTIKYLPVYPSGSIVTKSVPGSNDVKIEIDSNSLLDRVILYSLKNTVVDNSRLDAAKNKYMLNNGNITPNLTGNSNGSDSNSSCKSIEKLLEEIEGGSKASNDHLNVETLVMGPRSDISNQSTGAEKQESINKNFKENNETVVKTDNQNIMLLNSAQISTEFSLVSPQVEACSLIESKPPKPRVENEALDFRDKTSSSKEDKRNDVQEEKDYTVLEISNSQRDEKSVPIIKRNHALYVGLPDFSKQTFKPLSTSHPTSLKNQQRNSSNINESYKNKSQEFSNLSKDATDLRMRHPDFSKSFEKSEAPADLPVTLFNFPEIVRKNNYISDLQLKPLNATTTNQSTSFSSSTALSYKTDYNSSAVISNNLLKESKNEQTTSSQTVYPNMKKEGINAYNQQLFVDEPMAHIIHKNQFLHQTNETTNFSSVCKDRDELRSAPSYSRSTEPPENRQQILDNENKQRLSPYSHSISRERPLSNNPSYNNQSCKEKEFNNNSHESLMNNEFSLKQKEQQLRQEGTIITVKNEAVKIPLNETSEMFSADLFRDYKLKQPKESSDTMRRDVDHSIRNQQSKADSQSYFPQYNLKPKLNNISQVPPLAYSLEHYTNDNQSNNTRPLQCWPPPPLVQQPAMRNQPTPTIESVTPSYKYHSSSSHSPYTNHQGFSYPPGTSEIKINQNYHLYRSNEQLPHRNNENKVIQGQQYPPPSSSSSEQKYYHQRYTDFSSHFNVKQKQLRQEHNATFSTSFIPIEHRKSIPDTNFQRFTPHHQLEIRTVKDQNSPQDRSEPGPSYYSNSREREPPSASNYLPEKHGPILSHHTVSPRFNEGMYERSKGLHTLRLERKFEEHSKHYTEHSTILETSDVPILSKIKTELTPTVSRSVPSAPCLIKSTKPVFVEVKRESPLDLSVKTVKTKADSTGCDQDITSRLKVEQSGLKVEFTPNFANVPKSYYRHQTRPYQNVSSEIPQNVSDRSSYSQKNISHLHNNDSFAGSISPQTSQKPNLLPHASTRPNYFHGLRNELQPLKNIEGPQTTAQLMPACPLYSNHPIGNIDSQNNNILKQNESGPTNMNKMYTYKGTKSCDQFEARRIVSHYSHHTSTQARLPYAPLNNASYSQSPALDSARPPVSRAPLFYERERDRKYVEKILNRRRKNETETHHFQPIVSPPRKRILEQNHYKSSVEPKQENFDEHTRAIPETNNESLQFQQHLSQQKIRKIENDDKNLQTNVYQKQLIETKFQMTQEESTSAKNHGHLESQYYPNPKAEMIHLSDSSSSYKPECVQFPKQNFQLRPDDTTLQIYQRIHRPIQTESDVRYEHQITGLIPGTSSGESTRMLTEITPISLSGSSGSIARGADQSTILKLKTNLEKKLFIPKIETVDNSEEQQKKDLSPRQFRTKGELKGFIPLTANYDTKNVTINEPPSILAPASSAFDLLDWGSACSSFVQQLETGTKQIRKKRSVESKAIEVNHGEKSKTFPISNNNSLTHSPNKMDDTSDLKEEKISSSDEDKPLLELLDEKKSHKTVVEKISEKISRNAREKQRMELEQKLAARLGPSSSESETEVRKAVRTVVRVRRLRKRAALGIKKSDEEPSVEEEETEEELCFERSTRLISKLDDLTSSEDDERKISSKCKKSNEKGKTVSISSKDSKSNFKLKQGTKKQGSSSESLEIGKGSSNKTPKQSFIKNAKKTKDSEDGPTIKKVFGEEKTMTRSKRKLEIEKKLSNSKILRNDKIVQNVSPDKKNRIESPGLNKKVLSKRKDFIKTEENKCKPEEDETPKSRKSKKRLRNTSKGERSSSSEGQEEYNQDGRLRPRRNKQNAESPLKISKESPKKKIDMKVTPTTSLIEIETEQKTSLPCRIPFAGTFPVKDEIASKFTTGWETDTYNYKRSLKIPAGLITIGRPPQHGVSHSLPDLDPQTSDASEIFSEFVKSKDKNGLKDRYTQQKAETPKKNSNDFKKASSIIDLLHQRIIQSGRKFRIKKVTNVTGTSTQSSNNDLLPTPEKESEKVFGIRKNIFETSIINSRTRTENNALRKKEILKEVFGADDERPKSAPPVGATNSEKDEKLSSSQLETSISYDQKYREYLEKMNVDLLINPSNTSKDENYKTFDVPLEDEDDEDDDNETVVASEKDVVVPLLKGKMRRGRGRRCKGSSGFDYIRKKKKATTNASENPMSVNNIIKKRLAAMENLENKDESHISKEIKGWVLNKGVGESVLHKASRLDYVDVIAYCLDRLNMSPDPKDNAGYTPLHEACSRGHLEVARILLKYGASHSETALSGIRPLHEAIENGHIEIVRLLISYGADPCLATYSGQLPITMAEDKEMENFLSDYLMDIDDKYGLSTAWFLDGPFKVDDPSEEGYEVFNGIPILKTDFNSSVASVFSISLTSLVTATTQMSDNETVMSETTATPIKVSSTPMRAPSQDSVKNQQKLKKCDTNLKNLMLNDATTNQDNKKTATKETKSCSVVLSKIETSTKKTKNLPPSPKQDQITPKNLSEPIQKVDKHKQYYDDIIADVESLESDSEYLELEESEAPLPPLYLLRDEGSEKWILLTDLCNLLKVKSKDAVLKQICPSSPPSSNKELIRELKMPDFLEKAICLQLFCAGEKLNVRASKVSLVRYNDSVRNLLGVQTIRMNM